MTALTRLKNRAIAWLTTRIPKIAKKFTERYTPVESVGIPWTPANKPLNECRVVLVTTAGVHHREQTPFDMNDRDGDPTFRIIDSSVTLGDLMITHDYYDHSDADRDINIVFPIQRLLELRDEGVIGEVAKYHYGFMGHIVGGHIQTLLDQYAPDVSRRIKADKVDVALVIPG